jgi:putative PEP-CTERM system TPR-repeat lipoprotein
MIRSRLLAALSFALLATPLSATAEKSYLSDARAYLEKGDLNAAVIQLKNALQEKPSDVEARLLLGKIYLSTGNAASAEKELQRAVRLNASRNRWQVELGKAYLLQRKFDELLKEIEPDPTLSGEIQAEVHVLRGHAYRGKGEPETARKAYEKALAIRPDSAGAQLGIAQIALSSGERDMAREIADQLLTANPDNLEARLLRGELLKQGQQFDKSIDDFSHVLTLNPKEPRALMGRAVVNLQLGRLSESEKDLKVLNEGAAENPMVLYLNGVLAFQQRKLDQAEEYIGKVLNLQPNHVQSQLIFGAIRFSSEDYVQADEYLTRAHKSLSTHLPTIKLLAAARIKQNKHQQAAEILAPAIQAHPKDAQIKAMLGNSYLKLGRYEEGSELLGEAVEIMPNIASLRTQHAFGLLAQGDTSTALGELQSAVNLGQDLIQADVLLVLTHLRNKETDEALEASRALEARQPDNPLAHNLTGLAHLASGNEAEARAKFNEALALDPKFVTAEINLARIELTHNRLPEAEKLFDSILQKDEKNLTALLGMAGIEERRNNRQEMYQWLEMAREKNPASSKAGVLIAQSYLREGDHLKALRAARESVSVFPKDPAVLRVLASAQVAGGEINSAVQSLQQLVGIQRSAQNYVLLAAAQRKIEDDSGARASIETALEIDEKSLPAISMLGDIALKQKSYDEAVALAKRAQTHFGNRGVGYELEAVALLQQDKVVESLALFEQAYKIQPSAKLALQLTRLYRAQNQTDRGLAQLVDWLEKSPNDARTRAIHASMLQGLGREAEAISEYERVLATLPDQIVTLNNLAWLYQKQGDRRALEIGERAYKLGARQPEIVDTYGWILVTFGQPEKGLEVLREAMSKMPDNPEVAYHVGFALHKLQRTDEAQRILSRIVRDHADSAAGKQARALLEKL